MKLEIFTSLLLLHTASAAPASNTTDAAAASKPAAADAAPECCKQWAPLACSRATIDVEALAEGTLTALSLPGGPVLPRHSHPDGPVGSSSTLFQDPASASLSYLPDTKSPHGFYFQSNLSPPTAYNLEACREGGFVWREVQGHTGPTDDGGFGDDSTEESSPSATTEAATPAVLPGDSSDCCQQFGNVTCEKTDIDVKALGAGELKFLRVPGGKLLPLQADPSGTSGENQYLFANMAQLVLSYVKETQTVQGYGGTNAPGANSVHLESCNGGGYIWREVPN